MHIQTYLFVDIKNDNAIEKKSKSKRIDEQYAKQTVKKTIKIVQIELNQKLS